MEARNSLPKQTFQKSLHQLVNAFELLLVCDDYVIGGCVLKSCFIVEFEVVILIESDSDTVFHV